MAEELVFHFGDGSEVRVDKDEMLAAGGQVNLSTRICPDCKADGDKDERHTADCARGKGWAHAKKSRDERAS